MSLQREANFLDRWSLLGVDLFGAANDCWLALGESLLARYKEPLRHYHRAGHIIAVLDTLAVLDPKRGRHPAPRLAAFFHDAIYDPTASDNEQRSAVLAANELGRLAIADDLVAQTVQVVLATADHRLNGSDDVALFLDADLAILGAPVDIYDDYAKAIRREYGHLACDVFSPGRVAVLQTFLDRPELYFTKAGQRRFDSQGRANLTREIDQLTTAATAQPDEQGRPTAGC